MGWLFFLFLKVLRKKIVFTIHEVSSLEYGILLNDLIMAKIANSCDAFFVHTNYTKEKIQKNWKVQKEKISVVPHGSYYLDCENCISKEYARKRLKYRQSDYVLLSFGIVSKYKGLDYLLLAVAEAKKVLPNLKLIIAGRPINHSIGEHYRKLISDLGLEHEVNYQNRFIRNKEIAGLFCCCDIVVLPYIEINQSGVLCMSSTFGRPVIATQVGGLPEMVHDGITGYIIPPADIDALTEKIIEGWHHRERLQEMGSNAQKLMNEEYSWDRLAEYTVGVYKEMLSS